MHISYFYFVITKNEDGFLYSCVGFPLPLFFFFMVICMYSGVLTLSKEQSLPSAELHTGDSAPLTSWGCKLKACFGVPLQSYATQEKKTLQK